LLLIDYGSGNRRSVEKALLKVWPMFASCASPVKLA